MSATATPTPLGRIQPGRSATAAGHPAAAGAGRLGWLVAGAGAVFLIVVAPVALFAGAGNPPGCSATARRRPGRNQRRRRSGAGRALRRAAEHTARASGIGSAPPSTGRPGPATTGQTPTPARAISRPTPTASPSSPRLTTTRRTSPRRRSRSPTPTRSGTCPTAPTCASAARAAASWCWPSATPATDKARPARPAGSSTASTSGTASRGSSGSQRARCRSSWRPPAAPPHPWPDPRLRTTRQTRSAVQLGWRAASYGPLQLTPGQTAQINSQTGAASAPADAPRRSSSRSPPPTRSTPSPTRPTAGAASHAYGPLSRPGLPMTARDRRQLRAVESRPARRLRRRLRPVLRLGRARARQVDHRLRQHGPRLAGRSPAARLTPPTSAARTSLEPLGSGPRWRTDPTGNLDDGDAYVVRHPAGAWNEPS